MKRIMLFAVATACSAGLLLFTGCEGWSSGGSADSFNTSEGAGISINFSGVFNGNLAGGLAVSATSGGPITRLVVSQSGNAVEVEDNNGSKYKGSVGSPGAVADAQSGVYPAGAELAQSQIAFSGHDNVAAKNVQFVGIIHAVAVADIKGSTTSDNSTSTQNPVTTTTTTDGTNLTVTTVDNTVPGTTVTIVKTENAQTGQVISQTTTTTHSGTATTTYSLTEANTQYRLEGTWVEEGGVSANVDALSQGASGTIASTTAAATTP